MAAPPTRPLLTRWLAPIAELRAGEGGTALLLFLYSFLAMTLYNIVKPVTRSQFISSLGADNLPWVQFGAGMLIGLLMQAYTKAIAAVPRRWTIPVTQAGMIVLLVTFWLLFTQVGAEWVSVGFYLFGLILGILLISQFWTLANDIYDPRQAKRLFGFIGGGASLGGVTGSLITAGLVETLGTKTMLWSAPPSWWCACSSSCVSSAATNGPASPTRRRPAKRRASAAARRGAAARLAAPADHRAGHHLCGHRRGDHRTAVQHGGGRSQGPANTDGITAFLAQVTVYLSLIGLFIQVALTSRIHRLLGIGFALMILPVSLGASGLLMLTVGALWTPAWPACSTRLCATPSTRPPARSCSCRCPPMSSTGPSRSSTSPSTGSPRAPARC